MRRRAMFFIARIAIFAALSTVWIAGHGQIQSAHGTIADVLENGTGGAIARMVDQGIIPLMSREKFEPTKIVTGRQFAVAVSRMFNLQDSRKKPLFRDVPSDDPDFAAINSIAPYLQRQAFCPGCLLAKTFQPDATLSPVAEAAILTGLLIDRHDVSLLDSTHTDQLLLTATHLAALAPPARRLVATAVQSKIVSMSDLTPEAVTAGVTRARLAVVLDALETRYKLSAGQ